MKADSCNFKAVAEELVRMRVHNGYTAEEIASLLRKLGAETFVFKRGELVNCGVKRIGIVLEGVVHVVVGGQAAQGTVLRMLVAGSFVGLAALVSPNEGDVGRNVAFTDGTLLTLSVEKLLAWRRDPGSDRFFATLERQVHGMLNEMTSKCLILSHTRIEDRVLTYLKLRCESEGKRTVIVPGNEVDFANYLGVHAVALSRVLTKMKEKGLIDYRRNILTLCAAE